MAAQVEVGSGRPDVVSGCLHLSPLADSSNTVLTEDSPGPHASLILDPEPRKPVPGPKPRLTPKPFSVQRNATIRPILAPKPQPKPRLEASRQSLHRPDPPGSHKPEPSSKPKPAASRPAPTTFRPSSGPAQTAQAPGPKPSPGTPGARPTRPAAEWSGAPRPKTGGVSITRAKSMGFLPNAGVEDEAGGGVEAEDARDLVTLRPQGARGSSRPRPVSAAFLPLPGETDSSAAPVPAPRWGARRPLSANLTSKFEPGGLSPHQRPTKLDSKENIPETSEKAEGAGKRREEEEEVQGSGRSKTSALDRGGGAKPEDKAGNSIKRRISLFDSSSSSFSLPTTRGASLGGEPRSPGLSIPDTDGTVGGVKQRIRELTDDFSTATTPPQKPQFKPRPLPPDLTKRFVSDLESSSPADSKDLPGGAEEAGEKNGDSIRWSVSPEDRKTQKGQDPAVPHADTGPSGMQTVRASLFDNVVERHNIQVVEDASPPSAAPRQGPSLGQGPSVQPLPRWSSRPAGGAEDGRLVTAVVREPSSPSTSQRVEHVLDTLPAVEESRAVVESVLPAQLEERALTLRSRRSDASQQAPAGRATAAPEGWSASMADAQASSSAVDMSSIRYLRVGALVKWDPEGGEKELERGRQREVLRDMEEELQKQMEVHKAAIAVMEEEEREAERQRQLEAERQRQLEAERQRQLEAERQRQLEAERQRQLEAERQRQLEAERQRQLEAERQRQLEAERQRQFEAERQRQLEAERQRQLEAERQRQLEAERQRQLEAERQRQLEAERQRQLEAERQRQFEAERQRQLEAERQRQLEAERQRQLEAERQRQLEAERQRQLEAERQRQLEAERQRQLEAERQRQLEAERQRQLEAERQRQLEAERQRQLEAERQRQLEAERQRQLEAERQRQLEAERQRQLEAERQRQLEAERQRESAVARQPVVLEDRQLSRPRATYFALTGQVPQSGAVAQPSVTRGDEQAKAEVQFDDFSVKAGRWGSPRRAVSMRYRPSTDTPFRGTSPERSRRAKSRERTLGSRVPEPHGLHTSMDEELAIERQKLAEYEKMKETNKQRELEKQKEADRLKQLEFEKRLAVGSSLERQRQKELEREKERMLDQERLKLREFEKQKEMELERERQLEMERRRETEKQKQRQTEKVRQREVETGRARQEVEKQRELERQRPESLLRPKVLDLDLVSLDCRSGADISATPQWKQPSGHEDNGGRSSILDVDSFGSQMQPGISVDPFGMTAFVSSNKPQTSTGQQPQAGVQRPHLQAPDWVDGNPGSAWPTSPTNLWPLSPGETTVDEPLWVTEGTRRASRKASAEDLLQQQETQSLNPTPTPRTPSGISMLIPERVWTAPADSPAPSTGRKESSMAAEPDWTLIQERVSQEPSQTSDRGQGTQESRMRSRSVGRRSTADSSVDGPLSRLRSQSAHMEQDRQNREHVKQTVSGQEEAKDTDVLVQETDSQYGTWDTGLRTDDSLTPATPSSDDNLTPSPRKPTPPQSPVVSTDTPTSPAPWTEEQTQPLPLPEISSALLDSSVLRSRVQLSKRSSRRAPPSRAARQSAALSQLIEGAEVGPGEWRYRDSSEDRVDSAIQEQEQEEEEEEEEQTPRGPQSTSTQPQRVSLFPGMDPSALMAQLKKRGDAGTQPDGPAPSPSQLSRSPKSPFLPRASRVLPPAGSKENGEESSPQWLKELKSKKRLSQYETDG